MKTGKAGRAGNAAAGFFPDVRFPADYLRRVELLTVRLAGARERREGMGRARFTGAGEEFVGYRPYRPGEDLRSLDWNLLARLDRAFVRVTRREASERWAIFIDTSASMGVGPPGKLECAAHVACALCSVGLGNGASVLVRAGTSTFEAHKRGDAVSLMRFLEGCRAAGDASLSAVLGAGSATLEAGRVFVIGDFLDLDPTDLFTLLRRGRELSAVQLLAPSELAPPASGSIEWIDPENGESMRMTVDANMRRAYDRRLERELENWDIACSRHRVAYGCWETTRDFEEIVREILS